MAEIFLGRTEEQDRFRQVLTSFQPKGLQRHLPTLTKLVGKSAQKASKMSFLLLFHGEGGMGKTTLINRLCQIAKDDSAFQDQFQVLFLDWEPQQKNNLELQVGHGSIRPETVLQVLHKAMVEVGWGGYFENYRKLVQEIQKIEAKVEKELRSPASVDLPKEVTNLGASGIAWLIRRAGVEVSTKNVTTVITTSAEGLHQARTLVEKALTPKEFDTYTQPHEKLAEALGKGLADLAKRKPVVILLDTFEIVDRPECDYTLRTVIRCGGERVVWAIAGRSNLADSGRRGKEYFRGYKADFLEDRLYAKSMSEFSVSDIQEYFAAIVPERPVTQAQAGDLAQFSLGIPFVVREAAAMWREEAAMETIVAPVEVPLGNISAHQRVVNQSSERFLKHCFSAKEQESDLQAVYALAMVRRPEVELLKAMLDCSDLEQALRSLRERYSFILVDPVGLAEKLASFVREYLLPDVRRTTPSVRQLAERAIAWLELTLDDQTHALTDTAEWFEDDRLAGWMIPLTCFHFWHSEDAGWRSLVPRFVEGWQYNRRWTSNLLEAVEFFQPYWSKDGQRRFKLMSEGLSWSADPEDTQRLLTELEKLAQRQWLDGTGAAERKTILHFKRGQLLYEQEHYGQALQIYLEVKAQLTETTDQLKTDLAEALYNLSGEFIWAKGSQASAYSLEGEQAIEVAVALNRNATSGYYYKLGVVKDDAGKYEDAIAAYQQAIALDPKFAYPHIELGNVYFDQGKYEDAIAAYRQAIALDPKYASPYNNLGEVYLFQNQLAKAETAFREAIQIGGERYNCIFSLGLVKALQADQDEAIALWQKSQTLCNGTSVQDRLNWVLINVALEDETVSQSEMQQIVAQSQDSKGLLQETLEYALLLAQCPVKPKRVDELIGLLRAALSSGTESTL